VESASAPAAASLQEDLEQRLPPPARDHGGL